ncbi:MAG TPA: DnaJ domain-containing protein [Candidatus Nanoarchaeia archaeon]|nr:DnaJ domain-containing protein [Candidatus Nanoarchaeia archaeon]
MAGIVKQQKPGDITFGVPKDVEVLNEPYGFYRFLGVRRNASRENICAAYKGKALQFHPDRGGNPEDFKNLQRVADILLDDGEDLGKEHSQRLQYDRVSSLDEHFDGFIESDGERTKKLSEIILAHMQAKRKFAEKEHEITQQYPEFAELKKELGAAQFDHEKEKIGKRMTDLLVKAKGLTPEARKQLEDAHEEAKKRFDSEQRAFVQRFSLNPRPYFAKILDVLYVDDESVTFGCHPEKMRLGLAAHEDTKKILRLILGGSCYIAGFRQVHFKAEKATVQITDPHLSGIVHVVKGGVTLDLESSSYGEVIRARGSDGTVPLRSGFERHGNLYCPTSFAFGGWWEKKPALDIAVKEGTVSLQLRSPRVAPHWNGGAGLYDIDKIQDYIINKKYSIRKKW